MLANPAIALPASTAEEVRQQAEREAAEGVALGHLFVNALKDIDGRLQLRNAGPGAKLLDPGFWYIMRFDDNDAPAYWKITEKGGLDEEFGPGYSHPEWAHLEALKRRDSWRHPNVWREFEKRRTDARLKREKDNAELHREFRERLLEKLDHIYGPKSIAVTAAMKARADGLAVSEAGVVLPNLIHDRLEGRAAVREIESRHGFVEEETTPASPESGGGTLSSTAAGEPILSDSSEEGN